LLGRPLVAVAPSSRSPLVAVAPRRGRPASRGRPLARSPRLARLKRHAPPHLRQLPNRPAVVGPAPPGGETLMVSWTAGDDLRLSYPRNHQGLGAVDQALPVLGDVTSGAGLAQRRRRARLADLLSGRAKRLSGKGRQECTFFRADVVPRPGRRSAANRPPGHAQSRRPLGRPNTRHGAP
jgi:hypothetical protein